jgi:hypothetical protein
MLRSVALALSVAIATASAPAFAAPGDGSLASIVELSAHARAAGNRKADAIALARVLLGVQWPAQILKVRVDGAGSHEVAGLVLSGVKFHRPLDSAAFTDEVIDLLQRSFAGSAVEEVDIWAVTPLPVSAEEVKTGEYLRPTALVVYSATVLRSEGPTFATRLRHGTGVYWNPAWHKALAHAPEGSSPQNEQSK